MLLSIYAARKPIRQYAEMDCFAAAGTKQDMQLIKLAIKNNHPALIGLDGENTIIKPLADGDEKLSFEGLYDECYTIADLAKMADAGVDQPEDIPPRIYRLGAVFALEQVLCDIPLALRLKDHGESRQVMRKLIQDTAFVAALGSRMIQCMVAALVDAETIIWDFKEITEIDPAKLEPPMTADQPGWRFLDED